MFSVNLIRNFRKILRMINGKRNFAFPENLEKIKKIVWEKVKKNVKNNIRSFTKLYIYNKSHLRHFLLWKPGIQITIYLNFLIFFI